MQWRKKLTTVLSQPSDLTDLLGRSGVSLLLKLGGGLAAFITTVIVGRGLGPAGAGFFFLSLAIVTVVSAISRLGYDQAITRFVAEARERRDWEQVNAIYRRSMVAVSIVSSVAAISLFVLASIICLSVFRKPDLLPVFRWMSLSIVGFALTWLHSHFFQGMDEIKRFQLFQNLGLTTLFIIIVGCVTCLSPSWVVIPETYAASFLAQAF